MKDLFPGFEKFAQTKAPKHLLIIIIQAFEIFILFRAEF